MTFLCNVTLIIAHVIKHIGQIFNKTRDTNYKVVDRIEFNTIGLGGKDWKAFNLINRWW